MINTIQVASINLTNIINNYLNFSQLNKNKIYFQPQKFSMHNCIHQIFSLLEVTAQKKGVTLKYNVDNKIAMSHIGDYLKLQQSLINLVDNAIKFTDNKGEVKLNVTMMEEQEDKQKIQMRIIDTGRGMDQEDLESVFIRNEQRGIQIKQGNGLGLSITQELVLVMGGVLNVESTKGKGTCFYFNIQLEIEQLQENQNQNQKQKEQKQKQKQEQDQKQEQEQDQNQEQELRREKLKGKKILVCEDNKESRMLLKCILDDEQIESSFAMDGRKAVEMVQQNYYDLIFMDMDMPLLNGIQVTQILRKSNLQLPIVAITGNTAQKADQKCYQAGMNYFITKPFKVNQIKKVIQQLTDDNDNINIYHEKSIKKSNNIITSNNDLQFSKNQKQNNNHIINAFRENQTTCKNININIFKTQQKIINKNLQDITENQAKKQIQKINFNNLQQYISGDLNLQSSFINQFKDTNQENLNLLKLQLSIFKDITKKVQLILHNIKPTMVLFDLTENKEIIDIISDLSKNQSLIQIRISQQFQMLERNISFNINEIDQYKPQ